MATTNKTILVTGGNRGIGLEICRQLAAGGHTVLLGARDPDQARTAAAELPGPGRALVLHLDVTREEDIWATADVLRESFGDRLDVLINNASIMDHQRLASLDEGDFRRTLETNFFGALRLTRQLLPQLKGGGRVVNLSSGLGASDSLGQSGNAGYRFSKWALNGLTIMLAGELAGDDIKVNAVCPGWVRTDMGGSRAPRSVAEGADTPVWLATAANIPTGKFFRDRKEISW